MQIDEQVAAILHTSRLNNNAGGITGALVFNGDAFAQILEGHRETVEAAFQKIRLDPRHSDVVLLDHDYHPHHLFRYWSMVYSDERPGLSRAKMSHEYRGDPAESDDESEKILQRLRNHVNARAFR